MPSALPSSTLPTLGLWLHLAWARPRPGGTHRLVGGLLLPASLPHGQVEGVLHTGLQALPRDGDHTAATRPEVQRTSTSPTLWPMTGGSETLDLPQSRARPRDSWGYSSLCWTQAYQDSVSKHTPLPMLGSLVQTT